MFLYDFATKTAQKPDTVATYIRRNEKIFKNHVERREKQLWLDDKSPGQLYPGLSDTWCKLDS